MASLGPNFPTSVIDSATIGVAAWANPGNAKADDGNNTQASMANLQISHYLQATGFGFAIPAGATILGVKVEVKAATFGGAAKDYSVRLVTSGTVGGTDRAVGSQLTGTLTYGTFGGPADLWGLALTPSIVNNTGFGVAYAVQAPTGPATGFVDAIRITVYYTAAIVGTTAGETSATTDSVAGHFNGSRTAADTSVTTEAVTGHHAATRAVTETSVTADTASGALIRQGETSKTSDLATGALAGTRAATEESDSSDLAAGTYVSFVNELSLSDDGDQGQRYSLYPSTSLWPSSFLWPGGPVPSGPVAFTSLLASAFDVSQSADSIAIAQHHVTITVADQSATADTQHTIRRGTATDTSTSVDVTFAQIKALGFQIRVRERAPLKLTVGIATPAGLKARWGADDPDPRNAPSGLSFSTVMPGGYEQLDCVLTRDPAKTYPDLEELSTITVYGAGKQIAGQFRLEQLPDQSGDQMSVSPGAVGWQAHLDDNNSAREIFVDRDITQWQGPSVTRQIQWLQQAFPVAANGPNVGPDFSNSFPSLIEELAGTWTENQVVEAWYDGHGIPIGRLYGAYETNGLFTLTGGTAFGAAMFLTTDDTAHMPYDQLNPLLAAAGTATLLATTSRPWALLQFYNDTVPGGKDGVNFDIYWTALGVYGRHGLPLYGTADTQNAQGVLASDAIAYSVNKWCPKLKYSTGPNGTIQPSAFVVPHLVFLNPSKTSDILKEAAKYELLDWAVWEGPTFYLNPRGARGRKWRARTGPAKLQEAGPQIGRMWNGVIVEWSDVSGVNRTIGPPGAGTNFTDPTLLDTDPTSPLNQAGIQKWALVSMGTSTQAGATQTGRLFLQEQKTLDVSGQATLTGHAQDSNGIWWPAWMIRAGDQISFTDSSDTSYRRIVHTSYDDSSKSNALQLDQPPDSLQAVLDRLSITLNPYGMS